MEINDNLDFSQKIRIGLKLYWKRLVEDHAKEDGELVFSKDKKIYRVKAKDLLDTV